MSTYSQIILCTFLQIFVDPMQDVFGTSEKILKQRRPNYVGHLVMVHSVINVSRL